MCFVLQDECSFVSLRDVERVLQVMMWFYRHREMLFTRMNKLMNVEPRDSDDDDDEEVESEDSDDELERMQKVSSCLLYSLTF